MSHLFNVARTMQKKRTLDILKVRVGLWAEDPGPRQQGCAVVGGPPSPAVSPSCESEPPSHSAFSAGKACCSGSPVCPVSVQLTREALSVAHLVPWSELGCFLFSQRMGLIQTLSNGFWRQSL